MGCPASPPHDGKPSAKWAMIPASVCQPWRADQSRPCRRTWPSWPPAPPLPGTRSHRRPHWTGREATGGATTRSRLQRSQQRSTIVTGENTGNAAGVNVGAARPCRCFLRCAEGLSRYRGDPAARSLSTCKVAEDHVPKLLLLLVGLALVPAAVLLTPRAVATVSAAPSSIQAVLDTTSAVEHTAYACERRRVCRPGAGCAWRKVCKRW